LIIALLALIKPVITFFKQVWWIVSPWKVTGGHHYCWIITMQRS